MTRDEFIARAADAILRQVGEDPEKAAWLHVQQAIGYATTALDAVGAWEALFTLYELRDEWFEPHYGQNDVGFAAVLRDNIRAAIAKAEGRQ